MKKLAFVTTLLVIFLAPSILKAQSIKCSMLAKYIKANGEEIGLLDREKLQNSSWLREVRAFEHREQIYVIVRISRDRYDYGREREYIYCDIPQHNWNMFYQEGYFSSDTRTYGEKFHDYIYDHKCDCE